MPEHVLVRTMSGGRGPGRQAPAAGQEPSRGEEAGGRAGEDSHRAALEELARERPAEAIPRLIEKLGSESLYPEVGGGELGVHTSYGYADWWVLSPAPSRRETLWPARALVKIGAPAVDALVAVLMGDHRWMSFTASKALIEIAPENRNPRRS